MINKWIGKKGGGKEKMGGSRGKYRERNKLTPKKEGRREGECVIGPKLEISLV